MTIFECKEKGIEEAEAKRIEEVLKAMLKFVYAKFAKPRYNLVISLIPLGLWQ